MEHVARSQDGLAVGIEFPIGTEDVAIAADDFLSLGIPDDELLIAVLTGVELVDVDLHARTSASLSEGDFAQTTNFAHHVGCLVGCDDIDFVVALVGHAELSLACEFSFQ